jgi:hypothetical protein
VPLALFEAKQPGKEPFPLARSLTTLGRGRPDSTEAQSMPAVGTGAVYWRGEATLGRRVLFSRAERPPATNSQRGLGFPGWVLFLRAIEGG